MTHPRQSTTRRRKGAAYIVALLLLCVFCTIGLAIASVANIELQQCENNHRAMNARLAAESGLAFMLNVVEKVPLPGSTTEGTFCENLRKVLAERLDGTANLGGRSVTNTDTSVFVPEISVDGMSFCAYFTWLEENLCQMKVRGSCSGVTRHVTINLSFVPKRPGVFDYGLASRGQVSVFGNARIVGVSNPLEASVLSATKLHEDAISVSGSATISGDLYAAGEGTHVVISGSPKIAGSTDPVEIAKHIHQGVDEPDFPEIDLAPIAALATYTLQPSDPATKTVLNNVRIPAGANPNFASDIVLNGVMFIEAPNDVTFDGRCTLNGIVVTQNSSEPLGVCQLKFAGHVEANGVEALPDTPEFAAVKQQTGTFILAPGFGVTFAGNFSAINGSIAADQLTFTGTAEGTVKGSVIGLADVLTSVGGNVDIFVDHQSADPNPAGFVKPFALVPVPDSYAEVTE